MRIATLVAALFLACVSTNAGAAGPGTLIQASASFQRLGAFWISDDPTYAGAISALGKASACHLIGGNPDLATAIWRQLGVRMTLVTYGGLPRGKTGCTAPKQIWIAVVRVTGERWRTSLGLRVGDSERRVRRLYPRATFEPGTRGRAGEYWLVTRRSVCMGDCGKARFVTEPRLVAAVKGGRVTSINFVVRAQGE